MTETVSGAVNEALESGRPLLLVLAGPNGAGKSTFHDAYVAPLGLPFVNADRIALAMDPPSYTPAVAGYEAAELADVERRLLVGERKSFCMETVFSDPRGEKVRFLREAQQAGHVVILVFIGLDGPELSLGRVVQRVAAGGHDVPTVKLRKRFPRSVRNLRRALRFVDHAFLFDNNSRSVPFRSARSRSGLRGRSCGAGLRNRRGRIPIAALRIASGAAMKAWRPGSACLRFGKGPASGMSFRRSSNGKGGFSGRATSAGWADRENPPGGRNRNRQRPRAAEIKARFPVSRADAFEVAPAVEHLAPILRI